MEKLSGLHASNEQDIKRVDTNAGLNAGARVLCSPTVRLGTANYLDYRQPFLLRIIRHGALAEIGERRINGDYTPG